MPKVKSDKQGVKILFIRDFLYSHTDENHYVNANDILVYLESKGIEIDRKTLFSDIVRLETDYGMEIEHAGKKGYRVINHSFEPRELRLMIDSVQSARFITEAEAATIANKIKDLADDYTRQDLNERKAYVNGRIRSAKESVVERTDIILSAISEDMQISFKYAHYYPSLNRGEKKYSKRGEFLTVSPFALYWHNGNYYLYAYNKVSESTKDNLKFYRIDRMDSVKIETSKREGLEFFSEKTLNGQRKAKVFDMYSTGHEVQVTLRGVNTVADQVVDAFGESTILVPDVKSKGHFTANVFVDVSPTFFSWLTNFGNKLKIIAPQETKEEFVSFLHKALNQYWY